MTSQCTEPDLQMALLEVARSTDSLEPSLAEHLEECSDCQTAIERLRRMLSVWGADGVDDMAISSAAARFSARGLSSRQSPSWQDPISFAVLGAALGVALLIVVRVTSSRPSASLPTPEVRLPLASKIEPAGEVVPLPSPGAALRESPGPAALASPHIEGPHGVTPLSNGVRLELKAGESAHVVLAEGQSTELQGPCVVVFWSNPTQVGGWRLSRQPTEGTIALADPDNDHPLPGPGPTALPATQRAWARAAEALRSDDFVAADQAFNQLGHDSDAATRDAARLARAQLWIAHGRAAEVRPVLEDLASTGATALVRQRAAEFLNR
jgi:hypothetical protein